MRVQVVLAWPDRFESVDLRLDEGATVGAAASASGLSLDGIAGYAIHGERVTEDATLADGDRLELLRSLQIDPKEARRRRALARGAKPAG